MLNVAAHLSERARSHPEQVAVRQWERNAIGGGYHASTYAMLDRDSDDIARGLTALGIGRGVRTILMVPPGRDFFALAFGMAKAGVVPVLVDPGMGLSNLRACIDDALPEAFIGVPRAHAARLFFGWGRSTIVHTVTVGGWLGTTLDDVRRRGRATEAPALVDVAADEIAAILFTSGSTGVPKGVVYTHANFAEQLASLRRISNLKDDEVNLATFPPFALFDPALGMTTVVPDMDFARPATADPARLVRAITQFGVTNLFCSPALLRVIAAWAVPRGVKLPTLRRVISAGALVPADVIVAFVSLLSEDARVLTPYGATEALPVSLIGSEELLALQRAPDAGVCVGRAVPGVEIAAIPISDDPIEVWDESLRIPSGELGELVVRGPIVTREYFQRPSETSQSKIVDWHRMGDVGYIDDAQRVWFCGRKTERVELPQRTLFSVPCESVFDAHPEVLRSALVSVVRNGATVPVLCVQPTHDAVTSRPKLERQLRTLGAQHEHTAPIQTFLFRRTLPVDTRHNAKIRRGELARWADRRLP